MTVQTKFFFLLFLSQKAIRKEISISHRKHPDCDAGRRIDTILRALEFCPISEHLLPAQPFYNRVWEIYKDIGEATFFMNTADTNMLLTTGKTTKWYERFVDLSEKTPTKKPKKICKLKSFMRSSTVQRKPIGDKVYKVACYG